MITNFISSSTATIHNNILLMKICPVMSIVTLKVLMILVLSSVWCSTYSQVQNWSARADQVILLPDKLLSRLGLQATKAEMRLQKQSAKFLDRIIKKEKRLYSELYKKDSVQA